MTANTPAPMTGTDFSWAAQLMQRRRERYSRYSPVLWRVAGDATQLHARFLAAHAGREGSVALRTQHGFIIAAPQQGRCMVDDFAVEEDPLWATEGKSLLSTAWLRARSAALPTLRVVTARQDQPKRAMLISLGLTPNCRWWVKAMTPSTPAQAHGPFVVSGGTAVLLPAPPVYDPGGPVCLLGNLGDSHAAAAAEQAAAAGAVLAIIQRDGGDSPVPAAEPALEAAGYHNPAEFYQGRELESAARVLKT